MSFHIKRSDTADKDVLSQYAGLRTTKWVAPEQGRSVLEIQTVHNPQDLQSIPEGKNYLTPPYHWHWYQTEYFNIKQGRYIFTLEGVDTLVSASDPQPVCIPARARHTFKPDETCETPCVVEISADASPDSPAAEPEVYGITSKFFRNLYTYLDDCYLQGVEPSLPQLLVMLDSAEVSMAFSGPGWLMRPLSYAIGVVVGRWFGGYVLGYKASYPEYWNDELESRKRK